LGRELEIELRRIEELRAARPDLYAHSAPYYLE